VSLSTTLSNHPELRCPICDHPLSLETAKTDESGIVFHEECYVLKMELKRASERYD
jgi:hypothetical protein